MYVKIYLQDKNVKGTVNIMKKLLALLLVLAISLFCMFSCKNGGNDDDDKGNGGNNDSSQNGDGIPNKDNFDPDGWTKS